MKKAGVEPGVVRDEDCTSQPRKDFRGNRGEGWCTAYVSCGDPMDVGGSHITLGIDQGGPGINLVAILIQSKDSDFNDAICPGG